MNFFFYRGNKKFGAPKTFNQILFLPKGSAAERFCRFKLRRFCRRTGEYSHRRIWAEEHRLGMWGQNINFKDFKEFYNAFEKRGRNLQWWRVLMLNQNSGCRVTQLIVQRSRRFGRLWWSWYPSCQWVRWTGVWSRRVQSYIYNYTLRVQNCSAGRIVLPEFEPKTKLVVDFSSFLFESGVFVSVLNFIICSVL